MHSYVQYDYDHLFMCVCVSKQHLVSMMLFLHYFDLYDDGII